MVNTDKHLYEFGAFRLIPAEHRLLYHGRGVALEPKVFETLLALVRQAGRLVSKDELMNELWPENFVEESNLTRNISVLRKALKQDDDKALYIETVPKRGYRFVADVREIEGDETEVVLYQSTRMCLVVDEEHVSAEPAPSDTLLELTPPALPMELKEQRAPISKPRPSATVPSVMGIVLGTLLLFGLGYQWQTNRHSAKPSASTKATDTVRSLAVLPFKLLNPQSGEEYLGIGMADVVITRLSNLSRLAVRPTSSVLSFATLDPLQAGQALKVDTVLDGSIQKQGSRIRVTVRLVRVLDGQSLWSFQCDEDGKDAFTVQDTIARKVTETMALEMTDAERQRFSKCLTDNPEAFQAYLKGRFFWSRWNQTSLHQAIEYFETAISLDPNFAAAYSGLADSYQMLGYLGVMPPRESYPKMEKFVRKALELDDALAESHLSLAKYKFFYDWDFVSTEHEIQRALALNPHNADGHNFYGTYLTALGRLDEALAERKRALELDPLSAFHTTGIGWVYFYQGDYDQALTWYRQAIELDPGFIPARSSLSEAYYQQGKFDQAITETLEIYKLTGKPQEAIDSLKQAYLMTGPKGYWRKKVELVRAGELQSEAVPWKLAYAYSELGEKDQAFQQLNQAVADRSSLLPFLKVAPTFASLRNDPRFTDLLQQIGLTPVFPQDTHLKQIN